MQISTRLAALALVVGLLAISAPVSAAELDAHGWWWRAQTGATQLPPPPWVPEDGLAVANDVEGPSAIAGVRYDIGDVEVTTATLTLDVANEQGGEVAAIRACPARARWRGTQAGAWAHRPSPDCDAGEVSGERGEEGETWTFDVSLLVTDGVLNIILLPEAELEEPDNEEAPPTPGLPESPGGDGGATFQVAFEPPDDDSLEASGFGGGDFDGGDFEADGSAGDGSGASTSGDEPQEGSPPDVGGATPFQPDQTSGSDPVDEGRSSPPPDVADAQEPEQQPEEETALVAPSEDDRSAQSPVAARPAGFGDDLGRQAAALIALLTGAAAASLWRAPTTGGGGGGLHGLRRSLVVRPEVAESTVAGAGAGAGAATTPPRGLGRFARPREGDPPSL